MNTSTLVQKLWNFCNVLRNYSLADSDNLPAPGIIAREIVDDLEAALEQFRLIASDLGAGEPAWAILAHKAERRPLGRRSTIPELFLLFENSVVARAGFEPATFGL